jgi:hypothetical protein
MMSRPACIPILFAAALLAPRALAATVLVDPTSQIVSEDTDLTLAFARVTASGVTFLATGLPAGLRIDAATGTVSGRLGGQAAGQYTSTIRAVGGGTNEQISFGWTVLESTAPQLASPGVVKVKAGEPVDFTVAGTDPDPDALTYEAYGLPEGLAIDPLTGAITGTATGDASTINTYGVTVAATDTRVYGGVVFSLIVLPSDD